MNWNALRDGKCAKCGAKLHMGIFDLQYSCTKCDFVIGKEKFEKIAYGPPRFYSKDFEIDNLSALNNLGHEKVTEDFSDSPFKE